MAGMKRGETRHVQAQLSPGRKGYAWDLTGYTLIHTATSFTIDGIITWNMDNSISCNMAYTLLKIVQPSTNYDAPVSVWLGNELLGGGAQTYDLLIAWSAKSTKGNSTEPSTGWPWQ